MTRTGGPANAMVFADGGANPVGLSPILFLGKSG